MNGRPLALESALDGIPAVLETWFLGNESGNAIADIVFGAVSPAGRLPMGIPRTTVRCRDITRMRQPAGLQMPT